MPATFASSAHQCNPLATREPTTDYAEFSTGCIARANWVAPRCVRRHCHGEDTPSPQLQIVMLGLRHGGNDIDAFSTVTAPPRGIMGPPSGSLSGLSVERG